MTFFLASLTIALAGSHIMFIGNAWLSEGVVNIDSGIRDVQLRSDLAPCTLHTHPSTAAEE